MTKPNLEIKFITEDYLEQYIDGLYKHMNENGLDGRLIYAPYPRRFQHEKSEMLEKTKMRLTTPLDKVGWGRFFGLFNGEKAVGHLGIQSIPLEAQKHRCELGIGIDQEFQCQGFGSLLMKTAIEWAKNETDCVWLDLYVFGHNHSAIHLYKKFGFTEVATVKDRFRVDNEIIDDVHMTLRLN